MMIELDEDIPMSSERKYFFSTRPMMILFSSEFANILDDKCVYCERPIKASDFIDEEERQFYLATGLCSMCQAKWRSDMERLEIHLGRKPWLCNMSFKQERE